MDIPILEGGDIGLIIGAVLFAFLIFAIWIVIIISQDPKKWITHIPELIFPIRFGKIPSVK